MENKQTPVEWLVDQVEDFMGLIPTDIIEQAKAMEQEVWIPDVEEIENWASYDSQSEQERLGMIRGAKWMKRILTKNK